MNGLIHLQAADFDALDSQRNVIRKAIYDLESLPTGVTEDTLRRQGYQRLACRYEGHEKDFMVDVVRRKFIVIRGIPYYSSSGTSEDYAVISPAWRRNVWMPCMGFEVQRKPGRIAKLGDKLSDEFKDFVGKLISDWSKTISNEDLKLMYRPGNRAQFSRQDVLGDLTTQIHRYGSIEAFTVSMQLISDDLWRNMEEGGENFNALRALRDFYLKDSPHLNDYRLSQEEIVQVGSVSFEEFNEEYHVVEKVGDNQYRFAESAEVRKQETQKNAYKLNRRLLEMGADTRRIAQLNNPSAEAPETNSLTIPHLAFMVANLKQYSTPEEARDAWNLDIQKIVEHLLPLEQEISKEGQVEQYKTLLEPLFILSQNLKECKTIKEMSDLITKELHAIPCPDNEKACFHQALIDNIYEDYLSQLNQLTSACMPYINKNKPAYAIMTQLKEYLDDVEIPPKARIENFYKHLTDNDSMNLKVLQTDNSRNMKKFIGGVAIIFAIVITGVLPGLVISAGVYAAKGKSVLCLFKPHEKGRAFAENIEQLPDDLKNKPTP